MSETQPTTRIPARQSGSSIEPDSKSGEQANAGEPATTWEGVISLDKLERLRRKKKGRFQTAKPFPHLVFDDLLEPDTLNAVLEEFPTMSRPWHEAASQHELKLSMADESQFGPTTWKVFHSLNSSPFLSFLEKLTRIKGLIADPHLAGGGLHNIRRGGKLGVHTDFNFYRRLGVYRRLNVLIYLNHDWQKQWGGHLELWDQDKNVARRVLPVFNRAVIFETSPTSYHGHPNPLECPEDQSRKSLALYYYSVDYPYEHDLDPHSTIFHEKPAED